jgi:hypothetical protein
MTRERGSGATETDGTGQDLASLGQRFTALFIDWVACLVFTYVLNWMDMISPDPVVQAVAPAAVFIVYRTLALTFGSQSLGMALMRIACVSADHGGRLGFGRALVRTVLLSLLLPALTALADPYHRGLHDRASGSVMLRADA